MDFVATGLKRWLSGFVLLTFVLAGCLLVQSAFADRLNAWQVDDQSATALLNYTKNLSADFQAAATNVPGGFDYIIHARLVSGSPSAETMAMAYGLGTNRFLIGFSLAGNGDLIADLDGAGTYKLTTNGTGTALYHYHEILYNPATGQASYLFDGQVKTSNWFPTTNGLDSGEILWGAAGLANTGIMNFQSAKFMITNTVVAAYDAGTEGNPSTAPDPVLSGWTNDPDPPAADTLVTDISPDTTPLPAPPAPATLNATNVAAHQATFLGTGDQGNLAATVWFEWGADTNYGNTTPAQPLLSDTNAFDVSQVITGLGKGTTYHYRCVGTNLQGIAYGQDVSFTTAAAIPVTNTDDSGAGSLRQAIADSVVGDTIAIVLEGGDTITLTSGELLITNDLTIISSNVPIAIDGGGNSRVLEIGSSNSVVLDSLIITNGNAPDSGGGILVDSGGILTLTNCTVTGNLAGAGGGIYVSSTCVVALNKCILSGNSATNSGGAIDVETNSTLAINDSTFAGNSAPWGGAIFSNFASNVVNICTLAANSAEDGGAIANIDSVLIATGLSVLNNSAGAGGGIFNANNNSLLTLDNSILSGNLATNFGGGLINTNGGIATIDNCTVSSNACPADQGGGIDDWSTITLNNCTVSGSPSGGGFVNTGGSAVCNNSTFSGNVAIFDGGGYYASGGNNILNNCTISSNMALRRTGGFYENNTSSFLTNTIIAGNTTATLFPNVNGSISGANNLIDVDPLLAPLGNYGGPTQTMPPLGGSPAINAGADSVTDLLTTDQRGSPRLAGSHVDIGAVEIQPIIVMNTNDDGPGSLRAAASMAPELIVFTNSISGQTIHLTSGQLTFSNSVGIDGSSLAGGILIDGGGVSRVLEITASNTVTLNSLVITNGNVSDNGGGILVDDDVDLTITNCTVAGNSAGAGGGMFISSQSTVAINNSTFSGNSAASNGGAIDSDTNSTLAINNSTLARNAAIQSGGGITVAAGVTNTLTNCTISGNSAGNGGGVFQDPDSVSGLVNTIVAGNTAGSAADIAGPFTGANNLTNGNPLLAPLGNYGGPTQTMPPLAGSAAIDGGLDTAASLNIDQRGYRRLSGAHVDIGAVEAQVVPANQRPFVQLGRVQPGIWRISFTSISTADFTVLASTNLALPRNQWNVLGPANQNPPGFYQFTDSGATNAKARFYQVVSP
jgi:hypothetical protein